MNISPVSNVRFGEYFYKDDGCTPSQRRTIAKIEEALKTKNPSDNEGRDYCTYLDDLGYDVLVAPKYGDIGVAILPHPRNEADKVRKEYGEFRINESDYAGIYSEEHKFDTNDVVNDIMGKVNEWQKATRRNFIDLLLIPVPLIFATIYLGSLKYCSPKVKEPQAIERAMQDTTKIAKDTLQLFK